MFDKINKKSIRDINSVFKKSNEHNDTIYINETGLYILLIRSRMKNAISFQLWLVNDVLPNLRKYGKVEVNNKIKIKLKKLNKKILLLQKYNEKLKKNMIKNKYPIGTHIYIIEDEGLYKIGYTNNLKKRIATYNTGKSNKIDFAYYKKTKCGKEIELCLKAMLIKYIYKSKKEFYNCTLDKIIKSIIKCLKIEKECKNCKDIQLGGGETIHNNIIIKLIDYYQEKYNNYINAIIK